MGLCIALEIVLIDFNGGFQDFTILLIGQQFQSTFNGEVAAVEETLVVGYAKGPVRCGHGKPLDAVADLLAAAFGIEIIAGISCDADDFSVDAGLVLNAPQGYVVGTVVVADDTLGHDPLALVTHQKKHVAAGKYNAAGAASDCSSQG